MKEKYDNTHNIKQNQPVIFRGVADTFITDGFVDIRPCKTDNEFLVVRIPTKHLETELYCLTKKQLMQFAEDISCIAMPDCFLSDVCAKNNLSLNRTVECWIQQNLQPGQQ